MTVCETCGLPQELCVCESIAKESQKITIRLENKRYNKKYTVIDGIDDKEISLDQICKKLKEALACGGTVKENRIELQGEHKQRAKQILIAAGFAPETIIIK
ncbi:stress response translation initiation inhibitor YciH [Candidatus Woesearchaeota archaeon CG10_big_fil_rev_8_21_14_0_10_37_12]|nr:MAG: stress response translation initiation inhibitor YciH [Candidatus Woesearchaeota archaeon CG10_big_fil_rev_8_21_14_0_10_37_12]